MQENIYDRLNDEDVSRSQRRSLAINYLQGINARFNSDTEHNRLVAYEIAGLMSTAFITNVDTLDNDIEEIILFAGELEAPSDNYSEKIHQLQAMIEKLSEEK